MSKWGQSGRWSLLSKCSLDNRRMLNKACLIPLKLNLGGIKYGFDHNLL
jgi:hypothetical protein